MIDTQELLQEKGYNLTQMFALGDRYDVTIWHFGGLFNVQVDAFDDVILAEKHGHEYTPDIKREFNTLEQALRFVDDWYLSFYTESDEDTIVEEEGSEW